MLSAPEIPEYSTRLRRAACVTAVVVGSLGLVTAYGVTPAEALLYAAYELGFVIIPGWLAYRALTNRAGSALRQLALGWALGYVLEILAFMLTAATGTRHLFVVYPLVVSVPAVIIELRRRQGGVFPRLEQRPSANLMWLVAAVCMGAVVYVALTYFPETPLPGARAVHYFQDYPQNIALAAEAKHHWPIEDPNVSGQPLPYHYFVNIHMAAVSQVTGLALPLVFFRLFVIPLVILLVLELVVVGSSFLGSSKAGLIAACLVFFVGEMQLDTRQVFSSHIPFVGVLFTYLVTSPSFLFGLILFVPLVLLLGERLIAGSLGQFRDWVLVALFMIGASDAKVTILPLVLAALVLCAAWTWFRARRVPLALWIASALTVLVSGAVFLLQYAGHSSGLTLDPSAGVHFFNGMPAVTRIKSNLVAALPTFPGKGAVLTVGAILFGALGLLAPQLVGLAWMGRDRDVRMDGARVWLFSLFGAGALALFALGAPGTGNELYFFFYGLVAGCILAAQGLRIAWLRRPALRGWTKRIALIGVAWLLFVVAMMAVPLVFRVFTGPRRDAHTYLFWYGGLILSFAVLYAAARKWTGPTRWPAAALLTAAILLIGTVDTPADNLEPALKNAGTVPRSGKRVTPELYRALTWIARNAPSTAVIAVNNHSTELGPFEFDYAAFAERRVFLEGWAYSQRSRDLGYAAVTKGLVIPFSQRLALNDAVFKHANGAALRELITRYGVRYLVIDSINGTHADVQALGRYGRTVFSAPGVLVLEVR